jgi:hypothetical protein
MEVQMRKPRPAVRVAAALLAALSLASYAPAGTVAVPNQYASTSSGTSGLNTFIRDLGNPRTGQLLIAASELTAIPVGNFITGLTFRMFSGGTAFPPTNATWADYTINIAQGGPLPGSTTFANNIVGPITVCRTGQMTLTTGWFPVGGSPNPFGTDIDCTTAFQYTGGNLVIEIRHPGSNITNQATHFLEAVLMTHPDYGTRFWSATATGATATTGAANTFTVVRLQTSPTPVELLSVGVE